MVGDDAVANVGGLIVGNVDCAAASAGIGTRNGQMNQIRPRTVSGTEERNRGSAIAGVAAKCGVSNSKSAMIPNSDAATAARSRGSVVDEGAIVDSQRLQRTCTYTIT